MLQVKSSPPRQLFFQKPSNFAHRKRKQKSSQGRRWKNRIGDETSLLYCVEGAKISSYAQRLGFRHICAAAWTRLPDLPAEVLDLLQMGRGPPRRAPHTRPWVGPTLESPIGQSDAVGTAGQDAAARERLTCLAASPVASPCCRRVV